MSRLQIYHFHNGAEGGVWSVIKNLLEYSSNPLIENHIIYTINKDLVKEYAVKNVKGAITEKVFYYSARWNFNYTCARLAKLLPDDQAMVVAHDWLELAMVSTLGLSNPLVQFVHGAYDYYYQLSRLNAAAIDQFVAVAENIQSQLKQILPQRNSDVAYLRFPVWPVPVKIKNISGPINVVFIGRLEISKGYPLMPAIAEQVNRQYPGVRWHIIGDCSGKVAGDTKWASTVPVKFYGNIPNKQVLEILPDMDLLILPSLAEGMPVALIEAMKAGVVPIVNDIPGGIRELVTNDKTGYRIPGNNIDDYVATICLLITQQEKMAALGQNSTALANRLFDPIQNAKAIEDMYIDVACRNRKVRRPQKIYGSRLDKAWIPNWVTMCIRTFSKHVSEGIST